MTLQAQLEIQRQDFQNEIAENLALFEKSQIESLEQKKKSSSSEESEEEKEQSTGTWDYFSRIPLDRIRYWTYKVERQDITIIHPFSESDNTEIVVQYTGQTLDGLPDGVGLLQYTGAQFKNFYGSAIMMKGKVH